VNSDCSRLFRAHRTCCEMLRDRGYALIRANIVDGNDNVQSEPGREPHGAYESLDAFCAAYGNQTVEREHLTLLARRVEPPHDRIFVFFASDPNVGVKPIRTYQERMTEQKMRRAILVVQESVTPFAKKELASIAPQFVIEVFTERELLFNKTHSDLVPPHTLLTKAEKEQLLADWKVKEAQLPRINQSDPIARYYGYRRGQVCKIVRRSETAGRYVTYRITI
jgi:DNA-directed RNA polymerase I, II, and III subunit RPABC1